MLRSFIINISGKSGSDFNHSGAKRCKPQSVRVLAEHSKRSFLGPWSENIGYLIIFYNKKFVPLKMIINPVLV